MIEFLCYAIPENISVVLIKGSIKPFYIKKTSYRRWRANNQQPKRKV